MKRSEVYLKSAEYCEKRKIIGRFGCWALRAAYKEVNHKYINIDCYTTYSILMFFPEYYLFAPTENFHFGIYTDEMTIKESYNFRATAFLFAYEMAKDINK